MMSTTQILRVDSQNPEPDLIRSAAQRILAGRLVAFPTETVYGLGANALDPAALSRLFAAKGRPAADPLIAHIDSVDQLTDLALDIPPLAMALGKKLWPGPLTLILKRNPRLPPALSAGRDTVAVRQPDHPVAAALLRAAKVPIAAPSANRFAHPSPTTAQHVLHDLEGQIDLILDSGPTLLGIESTVLDLTSSPPTVLRPGGLPLERLQGLIPHLRLAPQYLAADTATPSPGQLLKHYSPNARLLLFTGPAPAVLDQMRRTAQQLLAEGKTLGLLVPDEERDRFADLPAHLFPLGPLADLPAIARNLFTGLRELDSHHVHAILVRALPRHGLGLAIWDRLFRAAEGRVIDIETPANLET